MKKEKSDRPLTVMVQPSLFEEFEAKCADEHRTVSEIVRELISKYIQGWAQMPKGGSVFYDFQQVIGEKVVGQIVENSTAYVFNQVPINSTFRGRVFAGDPSDKDRNLICSVASNSDASTWCIMEDVGWLEDKPVTLNLQGRTLLINWHTTPKPTYVEANYEYRM